MPPVPPVIATELSWQLVATIIATLAALFSIGSYIFNRRENKAAAEVRAASQPIECRYEHANILESLKAVAATMKQTNDTQVLITDTLRSVSQQQQQVSHSLQVLATAISSNEDRTLRLWADLLKSKHEQERAVGVNHARSD